MHLQVFLSIFFPLLFATFSASVYYSPQDEKPGDVECKYDLMKCLLKIVVYNLVAFPVSHKKSRAFGINESVL